MGEDEGSNMNKQVDLLIEEIKELQKEHQFEEAILKTNDLYPEVNNKDSLYEAKLLRLMTDQSKYNGEEEEAITNIKKSIHLLQDLNEKEELIASINQKGKLLFECLKLEESIETYEYLLELIKEINEKDERIKKIELEIENVQELQYMNFEAFLNVILDLEKKEMTKDLEKEFEDQYDCGPLEFLVRLYSKIATELLSRDDPLAVVGLMKKGIELTKELHFQQVNLIFKNNLGLAYAKLGNFNKAMFVMEKTLNECQKLGTIIGEAMVLRNMAKIKFEVQKNAQKDETMLKEILVDLQNSITVSEKISDDLGIETAKELVNSVTVALKAL
eukprot:gene6220-10226_t